MTLQTTTPIITANQSSVIMQQVTDNERQRLSPEKIADLDDQQKSDVVRFLIDQRRPVVAYFVIPAMVPVLQAAGYISGRKNALYPLWVRQEMAGSFAESAEPSVYPPKTQPVAPVRPPMPVDAAPAPAASRASRGPYNKAILEDEQETTQSGNNELAVRIGKQLKLRRTELKLTQPQLADRCNMAKSQISAIEAGRFNISIARLSVLLTALEMDVTFVTSPAGE